MTITMFRRNVTFITSHKSRSAREPYHTSLSASILSPPLLPPELVEAIIDEVGLLQDIPTLKSCSLVATSFVFRAQSHIFRTVDLDRKVPRRKYHDRFHRLLLAKPHLGLHVRRIRVGDDAEDEFGSRGGGRRHGGGFGGGGGWGNAAWNGTDSGGWILSSKTFPLTLQLLPCLEGFSLSFNSEMTDWRSIPPETRAVIGRLFNLPSLKAVSLEFISAFPVQLFLSLVRLRYLGLSCVEVEPSPHGPLLMPVGIEGRWESRLESLFLRGTSPTTIQAVSHALTLSSPSTLKKLSITPTFEDGFCNSASMLINATGSNITHFDWLPSIHFCTSVGPISINALPHLRVLRFLVSFRKTHAHGPFPEVLRLLGQVSSSSRSSTAHIPNHIETIVFDCHCIRNPSPSGGNRDNASSSSAGPELKALQTEWRPIDKILSRPSFSSLRHVKIRLSTSTSVPVSRERFIRAFQHLLPGLQSKGIIISVQTKDDGDERFVLEDFGS